jgi:hypothetical protein
MSCPFHPSNTNFAVSRCIILLIPCYSILPNIQHLLNNLIRYQLLDKKLRKAVVIPVLCSGSSGFESRSGNWLSSLRFFVMFLSPSLTSIYCRGQRMRGAMTPLPQYAFMAWCSVKAQGQLYLYLLPSVPSEKCWNDTLKEVLTVIFRDFSR